MEGKRASEIISKKLSSVGGKTSIRLLQGKQCEIFDLGDGMFSSDKLPGVKYSYEVFDIIVRLLEHSPEGKALKGCSHGREDKVGYGRCTEDTVVGVIAKEYFGKAPGESTFDPVFVFAAMLDWAGIARNCRGYVELIRTEN